MKREPFDVHRGDLIWVDCDPSIGVEPRKTRCCVVVSNDLANQFAQALTVVPTLEYTAERARRGYIVDLRFPRSTLTEPRVANASMVMTYDRLRVVARAGRVTPESQRLLDRALMLHLDLAGPALRDD
jgi:mRNA-degrading endonuclease toxin of MazEF toxin-antitoxin module